MNTSLNNGSVLAVSKKAQHGIPKLEVDAIQLLENFGVDGDYHAGEFVRHRYLAKKYPNRPNLRQVLLIDTTILSDLAKQDIHLAPGMMGENIILDGIAVMSLPIGTQIEVGEAVLEITEVRHPCNQLNESHPHLEEMVKTSGTGTDSSNAGMLARVLKGGWVHPGAAVIARPLTEPQS